MKLRHATLATLLSIPWLLAGTAAQEFTLQGYVLRTGYSGGVITSSATQETFSVTVSGCRWLIRENMHAKRTDMIIETGFDGTNVFRVSRTTYFTNKPRPDGALTIVGQILNGDMPEPHLIFPTALLWLAYASECLHNNPGRILPSPYGVPGSVAKQPSPLITWNDSLPILPLSVVFLGKGENAQGEGPNSVLAHHTTNAMYLASFRKVGDLSLPNEFKIWLLSPAADGPQAVTLTDEAVVTDVGLYSTEAQFRPALPGRALIFDRRLGADGPLEGFPYVISNANWQTWSPIDLRRWLVREGVARRELAKRAAELPMKKGILLVVMSMTVVGTIVRVIHVSRRSTLPRK